MEPELKKFYRENVVPELMKALGLKNIHQVPRIEKVVINSGISSNNDKAVFQDVQKDISAIAGQKAVITKAKTSISNFKLRQGMPVGVKVTLRGDRMYEFLTRLLAVSLPLIRDFRGLGDKFDGSGNYTFGISDHTIFPEISIEGNKRTTGMDISVVTTANTDDHGRELLRLIGFPFRKKNTDQNAA